MVICVYSCALTSASSIHKRRVGLIPTLTVDVSPSHSHIPIPFDMGSVKEYYFPVGEMFNLSCVIKNPSMFHFLSISRQTLFNNGSRDVRFSLIKESSYLPNPEFPNQPRRLQVQTAEFYKDYDHTQPHIRVSTIINDLQRLDTGYYKCAYNDIVKEIKVTVFKQAHSKNIEFPVDDMKSVNLGEPVSVGCRVTDVYPKPTVSFILPDGQRVKSSLVNFTDLSPENKSYSLFSELDEMMYTPKFSDHKKNLTCSVFSIGSTNLTVTKSLFIDVEGFELIADKCSTYFTADVNDQDVEFSCVYFSNPRLEPTITTNKGIVAAVETAVETAVESAKKIGSSLINKQSVSESLTTPKSTVVDTPIEIITISKEETDSSNYVYSIEEMNNDLSKVVLKIKQVTLNDFKDYTLKFTHNGVVTEHAVSLKKTGYDKRIKAIGSSASFLSNNIVHSTLAVTSLIIYLMR